MGTLVERATLFTVLAKLDNASAASVVKGFGEVLLRIAPLIVRQGQALLCRDPEEHLTEALQDRFKYTLQSDGSWTIARLMP